MWRFNTLANFHEKLRIFMRNGCEEIQSATLLGEAEATFQSRFTKQL